MKHLLEIAKIVTKKKVKKIEIFDNQSLNQKNSKFNHFYDAVIAQEFETDKEAAEYLYGCSPTDDKYRQLKSRFKKRLLNTLFFLDVNMPSSSNYNQAYYSCHRDWAQVKILMSNKAIHAAANLARQILLTALKFQFSDLILNCARILRKYSATVKDAKRYEEYHQYCVEYQKIQLLELEAEELKQRLELSLANNRVETEETVQRYQRLEELSKISSSPIILYTKYLAFIARAQAAKNYQKVCELCAEIEQQVDENPKLYKEDSIFTIIQYKLRAFLHLQDFEAANKDIHNYKKRFDKQEEWLYIMELYLLIALHCQQYNKAIDLYIEILNHNMFKKNPELLERWKLYEVYIHYLTLIEQEEQKLEEGIKRRKRFRIKRFLQEPINHPKHLKMHTLVLMIAQVLFLLEDEKRYGEAFERVERLKNLANRQLKKHEHPRSLLFVRLLQQLAKAQFNYEQIGVHQKYVDALKDTPYQYTEDDKEIELIPYEHLWTLVLNRTEKVVSA